MLLLLCPSLFLSLLLSPSLLRLSPRYSSSWQYVSLSLSLFLFLLIRRVPSLLPSSLLPSPAALALSILSFSRLGNSRADGFYIFKLLARKVALTFKSKGSTASMEESGPLSLFLTIRYTATVKNSFCNSLNPRSTRNLPRLLFRQVSDDEAISIGSLFCPRVSSPSLLFFLFRTTPHFAFNPSHFSLSLFIPSFLLSFLPPFRSFCCTVTNLFFRQRGRIEWIKRKREKGGGRRL